MDEGTRALLQAHLEKARQKQKAAADRETSDYEALGWVDRDPEGGPMTGTASRQEGTRHA